MRNALPAIVALLCAVRAEAQPAGAAPARAKEVLQVFTTRCVSCHSAAKPAGNLHLDSLKGVADGGAGGVVVLAGDSSRSSLYKRIAATDAALRMPPAGAPLSRDEVALIRAWIDGGAEGLPKPVTTTLDFRRDVEPILKTSCYPCHSGTSPKSSLRLDVKAAALKGGLGGPVILPGNSSGSRLIHRVEGTGGEQRMPLAGPSLLPAQITILRKWIDSGASWPDDSPSTISKIERHWAYRPIVRPNVPDVKGPVNNPIDSFLLAALAKQGMTFSAPAAKEKLLRRVTLDLTGLPPTPKEIDAFLSDARPDAYDRLVNRLIASPAYGERWARPWLDLARYADTNGYEADFRRDMWKYRDWVINAFNRDMPFDQFTIEQLAGDLLPGSTIDQKIATGFHRNTMLNEEGGVDKDESHFEVLVDRVNTTSTVWLGSTIGCAQCHNHKYDPFTQKEYYQLMAFFSNNAKKAIANGGTSTKYEEPFLEFPSPEQEKDRAALKSRIEFLETRLRTSTPELEQEQLEWERKVLAASGDWVPLRPSSAVAVRGTTLVPQADGSLLATGENPRQQTYVIQAPVTLPQLTGFRIEALPHGELPRNGPGRDVYGNFVVSGLKVEIDDGNGWASIPLKQKLADDGKVEDTRTRQLWKIDASREDTRVARQFVVTFEPPLKVSPPAQVRVSVVQNSDLVGQSIGRFRLSMTSAKDPTWAVQVGAKQRRILEVPKRDPADSKELSAFFRSVAPSLAQERAELKRLKKDLEKLKVTTALILGEQPTSERPTDFVRTRGVFSAKADRVSADIPVALGTLPAGEPVNRLTLAKWLVSRENPLTARVTVNRIWEQYFGRGLVETSEDFGAQGQRPTHPELLDWLAAEFNERGWKMKDMHRLIVTSAAYRQSSAVTPESLARDPYNRLISRGPRFRLEAEMVRDVALAASGLLVQKVGGPSVFPPQPPGIWDLPYNDDKWEESKGPNRYRRAIYTFIRRSAPYPAMVNFDAPSREACTVRRTRTNTPLQALTTLNDAAFFEAAQALGARMLSEGGQSDRNRVDYGFRLCTGRAAQSREIERVLAWQKSERAYYQTHGDEAKHIAPRASDPAEQAVWTMLANVLLNADESLTKE